jgi:hypothetical protein
MAYGVLKTSTNTGSDRELAYKFAAPLKVISNQPVFGADTVSLRRVVTYQQVQRWEIETNVVPTNDSGVFLAHSVSNGYHTPIYVRMPQVWRPVKTSQNLSVKLGFNASVGATTVHLTGVPATGLPVGEFIQFEPAGKVYVVTDSGTGGGTATKIFPSLAIAHLANDPVIYGDLVTMKAWMDSSVSLGITYTDGILSDPGTIRLIEKI